jgi:hypothetical protein
MVENKITIPYQIRGIKPSDQKKGYVEVVMDPVDMLLYHQDHDSDQTPIQISGFNADGNPFPPEFQHQISQVLKQAMPPFLKNKKPFDPRRLIHIESEIDFLSRDWRYGDIISVTLEKIKKAEEVQQDTE